MSNEDLIKTIYDIEEMVETDSMFYLQGSLDSLMLDLKKNDKYQKSEYAAFFIDQGEYYRKQIRQYKIAASRDSAFRKRIKFIVDNKDTFDSVKHKGYYIVYFAQGADSTNKADYISSYILLNDNYRIIDNYIDFLTGKGIID